MTDPSSPNLVRALFGLPFAVLLAGACGGNVVVDRPASCEEGLLLCGVSCIDPSTNPHHCGGCDVECGGAACKGGECGPGTLTCSGGLTACGGSCVDLETDEANCGACGDACPAGWQCDSGHCDFLGCACGDVCSAALVDPVVPLTATSSTLAVADMITPVCGPPGGADFTFHFAVPAAGFYTFRTTGSAVDTTLQVRSATTCEVLACDEGVLFDEGSMVGLHLAANEIVFVTVDTPSGEGEIQLTVMGEAGCVPCVEIALGLDPHEGLCAHSLDLYEALEACICSGPCASACQNVCSGQLGNDACQTCLANEDTGCGETYQACTDDS